MKVLGKEQELGVKGTPFSAVAIGIGGAFLGLSTDVFTLDQALLLIIAIATTTDAILDYFGQGVEE